ncbi:MAG: threonine synthase [Proteobacteria bacterium]|nr:threonine synthase [Pseudomonadota bacterium]
MMAQPWEPWHVSRGLRCISCGALHGLRDVIYRCGACGDLLDVVYRRPGETGAALAARFRVRQVSDLAIDRSGVWRFREMLPFYDDESQIITYPEGNTPLLDAPRCAQYAGLRRLRFKHLGFNPTGSFKDYGMVAGVTQARILGMRAVACASTGNTSASLAAYATRAGMLPIVLVPETGVSFAKLSQSLDYGALTIMVRGDFDQAQALLRRLAPRLGIYILNSVNPFRLEGQKTVMFELMEQLGWRAPDRIVVPGGNLGNSSSFGKALRELEDLGLLSKRPRLTIVQARGAAPLSEAYESGHSERLVRVHASTLATAIKIGAPVSWKKAARAVDWSDGWVTSVSEQEIADAKAMCGSLIAPSDFGVRFSSSLLSHNFPSSPSWVPLPARTPSAPSRVSKPPSSGPTTSSTKTENSPAFWWKPSPGRAVFPWRSSASASTSHNSPWIFPGN